MLQIIFFSFFFRFKTVLRRLLLMKRERTRSTIIITAIPKWLSHTHGGSTLMLFWVWTRCVCECWAVCCDRGHALIRCCHTIFCIQRMRMWFLLCGISVASQCGWQFRLIFWQMTDIFVEISWHDTCSTRHNAHAKYRKVLYNAQV